MKDFNIDAFLEDAPEVTTETVNEVSTGSSHGFLKFALGFVAGVAITELVNYRVKARRAFVDKYLNDLRETYRKEEEAPVSEPEDVTTETTEEDDN